MNQLRLALGVSDSKIIILISESFNPVSNIIFCLRCPFSLTKLRVNSRRNAIDNKKVQLYTAIELANAH